MSELLDLDLGSLLQETQAKVSIWSTILGAVYYVLRAVGTFIVFWIASRVVGRIVSGALAGRVVCRRRSWTP